MDGNLARLRDVSAEIEAHLRRVQLDAEKARKFREYDGRLRELRVGGGLREYHELTLRLIDETRAVEEIRAGLTQAQRRAGGGEGELAKLDAELNAATAGGARAAADLADAAQRAAAADAAGASAFKRAGEADHELAANRRVGLELARHVRASQDAAAAASDEVRDADRTAAAGRDRADALAAAAAAAVAGLAATRRDLADGRNHLYDFARAAAAAQTRRKTTARSATGCTASATAAGGTPTRRRPSASRWPACSSRSSGTTAGCKPG